jgi:hypothetical protein
MLSTERQYAMRSRRPRRMTMPARYVVAPGGTIEYADVSVDYTRRGDPSELIPVLAHLAAH